MNEGELDLFVSSVRGTVPDTRPTDLWLPRPCFSEGVSEPSSKISIQRNGYGNNFERRMEDWRRSWPSRKGLSAWPSPFRAERAGFVLGMVLKRLANQPASVRPLVEWIGRGKAR